MNKQYECAKALIDQKFSIIPLSCLPLSSKYMDGKLIIGNFGFVPLVPFKSLDKIVVLKIATSSDGYEHTSVENEGNLVSWSSDHIFLQNIVWVQQD